MLEVSIRIQVKAAWLFLYKLLTIEIPCLIFRYAKLPHLHPGDNGRPAPLGWAFTSSWWNSLVRYPMLSAVYASVYCKDRRG
jgi:hypothetical protein